VPNFEVAVFPPISDAVSPALFYKSANFLDLAYFTFTTWVLYADYN